MPSSASYQRLRVALLLALLTASAHAQQGGFAHPEERKNDAQPVEDSARNPSEPAPSNAAIEPPANVPKITQSDWLVPMTAGIISVALLAFAAFFLWRLAKLRESKSLGEQAFVKLAGLTMVISSGILLIVSGYSQNQIAGMMGLLGTVAGYLLGRDREPERSEASKPPPGRSDGG